LPHGLLRIHWHWLVSLCHLPMLTQMCSCRARTLLMQRTEYRQVRKLLHAHTH
jgi:hypothetical protein